MRTIITLLLMIISLSSWSQRRGYKISSGNHKTFFELQFRGDYDKAGKRFLGISPSIHHRLTPRFSAGIGGKYEMFQIASRKHNSKDVIRVAQTDIFGAVFHFSILVFDDVPVLGINPSLELIATDEVIWYDRQFFNQSDVVEKSMTNNVFVGLKFKHTSGLSTFFISPVFNLNRDELTKILYKTPVINFGFGRILYRGKFSSKKRGGYSYKRKKKGRRRF